MSSIPTKQIDGDVSVGRNVNVGGKADIKGSVSVGHNLKVEGWLDAKNIKGANKGVFTDITKLRETYPDGTLPDGSWAIVGGTLPGELWYVNGGSWVDSGKTAGSVTVDVEQYLEEVQTMSGDIDTMKNDIAAIKTKDTSQDNLITATSNIATTNNKAISDTNTALAAEQKTRGDKDTELQGSIDTLTQQLNDLISKSSTDGIDNYTEIINFLSGIKDTDTLQALLTTLGTRITDLETMQEEGFRLVGVAVPTTTPITATGKIAYLASEPGEYTNFAVTVPVHNGNETVKITINEGELVLLTKEPGQAWVKNGLKVSSVVKKIVKDQMSGQADGVAPLDSNGLIGKSYLPNDVYDVVWIDYWLKQGDTAPTPTSAGLLMYNETTNTLQVSAASGEAFAWQDKTPDKTKLYVDKTDNLTYRYDPDKSRFVAVSSRSAAASIYNPTVENDGRTYVLCDTEDTANSAVHVAKRNGKAALVFSFSWKPNCAT